MTLHHRETPFAVSARALCRVAVLAGVLAAAPPAAARPEPGGDPWSLCARAVTAAEARAGIPDQLLTAISLAESGRRHPARRIALAWPWTVMAEGNGQYLPSKAAAIDLVQSLQARGVRNIDVGCMQVNLKHHPDAFADLHEALDPDANAAYAARFLTALRAETGSWLRAMGRYHSATPERAGPYSARVADIWAERRQDGGGDLNPDSGLPSRRSDLAVLDAAAPERRPATLTSRFVRTPPPRRSFVSRPVSGATTPVRDAAAEARFAARRSSQIASWRELNQQLRSETGL